MSYTITLQEIEPLTHDVNRLVFDKPDGLNFKRGQATDFALARDGWKDEERPFTFTSDPDADHLEFVIKSYPDHDGVTARIADMKPGDTAKIAEPWGAIRDKGPGVFIAGGAGITPFIPILRQRAEEGRIGGCTLIFGNKTEKDIILRDEWIGMTGLGVQFVLSDEKSETYRSGLIDRELLADSVSDWSQYFYICGPGPMVEALPETLVSLGARDDRIVTEDLD